MGGGGADVSENAYLSCGGNDGLCSGGARWWVHYRFPRVCGELWEDLPNSAPFLFNFRCDVFAQPRKEKWWMWLRCLLTNLLKYGRIRGLIHTQMGGYCTFWKWTLRPCAEGGHEMMLAG